MYRGTPLGLLLAKSRAADTTGWTGRHNAALSTPRRPGELAVVAGAQCLCSMAENAGGWEQLGNDYVLSPEAMAIARALRGYLNADIGRLDGGTCDAALCWVIEQLGWNPDTYEPLVDR